MNHLLLIAVAGGAGALARYGLALGVQRLAGGPFPWGTLAVNVIGCLLFGFLMVLMDVRSFSSGARLAIVVGFLGSFTTFSTFAHDAVVLGRREDVFGMAAYLLLQNGLGLMAIWAGDRLGSLAFDV